jgi:hypothetical protein
VSDEVQAEIVSAILEVGEQYSYLGSVYFYTIMDTGTDLSDPEDNLV